MLNTFKRIFTLRASISGIIAANAGIQQLQQNMMNSANIDQARTKVESMQEDLDTQRKTKEAQINLANDQGAVSDYLAKSQLDFLKKQHGNMSTILDGAAATQDKTQHQIDSQSQQIKAGLGNLANTDPDAAGHINSVISAASGIPQAQPSPTPSALTGSLGLNSPTTPNMPTAQPGGALSGAGLPNSGQLPKPDISTLFPQAQGQQQGSQTPQGIDAQVRQPAASPAQTDKTMNVPVSQPAVPNMDDERSQYDTSPVTAASIDQANTIQNPEITKALQSGNPFLIQGAMKQMQDGTGFITAPNGVSVEQEKNPFFLNQWQQHLLNDNTSKGPVIDQAIRKYGVNQVMNEFPATVAKPAMMVAQYKQDPNNLSSTMGGGAQRRQFLALVNAVNPNWSEVKYAQIKGNVEQYLDPNTANGKALSALSQVGLHLDTLDKAMGQLNSTQFRDVPIFNKLSNMSQQDIAANPSLAAVNVALAAVHNEVTSAWAGTHNSDAKQAEWTKALANYSSSKDWPALRSTLATLLNEAADNREEQFEGLSNGMSLQDYRGYGAIPPGQRAILNRLQASGGQQTQGGGNDAFTQKSIAAGYSQSDIDAYLKSKQ